MQSNHKWNLFVNKENCIKITDFFSKFSHFPHAKLLKARTAKVIWRCFSLLLPLLLLISQLCGKENTIYQAPASYEHFKYFSIIHQQCIDILSLDIQTNVRYLHFTADFAKHSMRWAYIITYICMYVCIYENVCYRQFSAHQVCI